MTAAAARREFWAANSARSLSKACLPRSSWVRSLPLSGPWRARSMDGIAWPARQSRAACSIRARSLISGGFPAVSPRSLVAAACSMARPAV